MVPSAPSPLIYYNSVSLSLHLLAPALSWLPATSVEIHFAARRVISSGLRGISLCLCHTQMLTHRCSDRTPHGNTTDLTCFLICTAVTPSCVSTRHFLGLLVASVACLSTQTLRHVNLLQSKPRDALSSHEKRYKQEGQLQPSRHLSVSHLTGT